MSDYGRIGDALWAVLRLLAIVSVIAVPLALWKLVEIIIWIFS